MRRINTLMWPVIYFTTIFSVLAGRVFFANPEFWKYRDDSVIHLSHAKNFALFGSIGLSAGDRTEAMSSPLNYLISQLWFLAFPNTTYQVYLDTYLFITLAALSASWTYLLLCMQQRLKISAKSIPGIGILTIPIVLVSSSWTTFGWMISGMENALAASLLFLIVGKAFAVQRFSNVNLKLLFFLLGLTRIELAILILPLMIYLFGLESSKTEQNNASRRFRLLMTNLMPILVGWSIFHFLRFIYFGSILPNTATALGKSASVSMVTYLILQTLLAFIVLGMNLKGKKIIPLQCTLFVLLADIFLTNRSSGNFHFAPALLTLILLVSWILLFPKVSEKSSESKTLSLIVLLPINEYFLFGPARLSEFRIVSMFIPVLLVIAIGLLISNLKSDSRQKMFIGTILLATPIMSFALAKLDYERNLCCKISPSEKIVFSAARHFNEINDFPSTSAPIVASPDLGKVSFSKMVMNVDLGLIGDPLLSKVALETPRQLSSYLLNYVSPDLLQSHGPWSCRYDTLLKLPAFQSQYRLLTKREVSSEFNLPIQEHCFDRGTYSIWVKKVSFTESSFSRKLSRASISAIENQVRREIELCKFMSEEPYRCQYVYRGVLRNMNRIESSDASRFIAEAFRESPTFELDKARILKDRGWASEAFKLLNPVS